MSEEERVTQLCEKFDQLCDQNKLYVLAISEALLFAQNHVKSTYGTDLQENDF